MRLFYKLLPLLLICAFASATYAVDGCSSAGFKTATTLNIQTAPFGIAVADFNADGHLDLVAAPNSQFGELIIMFGRGGTERFGAPVYVPTGGPPRRLAAGDLNGDGKPDLAVSLDDDLGLPNGRLSILMNDGTGKFAAPSIVSLSGDPVTPFLGDLNNDGKLDIVVGLYTGTTDGGVAILLGDGAGAFSPAPNSPLTTLSLNNGTIAIGDFNEDNKRDLAIPASSGGISILLGDGAGGFATAMHVPLSTGFFWLAAADFNGDGHLDLFSDSQMILGTGTATFGAPLTIPIPGDSTAAFAGDVNNDGHLDAVIGGVGGLTIMLGNGTGNLAQAKSYASGFTIFGAASSFAALGDFNEDGKIDLAAVQKVGIGVLDGDGTGAFNDALSYHTKISNGRYLLTADFNNDGKQDFATVSSAYLGNDPGASRIEVALGDGSGGFTKKSVIQFFPGNQLSSLATADFNGDNKLDLAVTIPSNGTVAILLNDGTGGFTTDGFSAPTVAVGFQPSAIEAGDFNGDSKIDLIVVNSGSNTFFVLAGNGTGGFSLLDVESLQGSNSFGDDVAIGDFNADSKPDLAIIRSSANAVYVFQGNATGQFFPYATLATPGTPNSVAVRDLNGDGKPDIAVTSAAFETLFRQAYVTVLINNGAQGFNPGTNYTTDASGVIGIGDFNSDSQPDLAVSGGNSFSGNAVDGTAVFTNKGNGDFNTPVYFSVGGPLDFLNVGDFNNDSKDDLLINNGSSVVLLLNNFTAPVPCVSVNDVAISESDAGTIDAVFTVKLSASSAQTVKVNYFTSPAFLLSGASPATKGVDYDTVAGTLTFLPGETMQTIVVPIKGDVVDEFDQYFFVTLTTPINAMISDGKGLGTIVDNDQLPSITVNDVSVAEGTQNPSSANFTVSLSAASEKPITVQYALVAGTATPNLDYANFATTIDIPAGATSKTIQIPITQDNVFEPDETFFVDLSNPTNATIGDGQGQGTISNDDPQPVIAIAALGFKLEGAAGTSGNAVLEVKLSNPSFQTITVSYATADGTATAGIDYITTAGLLTFNPGETTKSVAVQVNGDDVDEMPETFAVNLSNPTNATISVAQGVVSIGDDDGPTVSIGNASVVEGNSGLVNAVFPVTLSAPSPQDVFLNYATTGGTATSNVDFRQVFPNTFQLLIPAGATSGSISIRIFPDFVIEPDEQFTVTLLNPINATIGTATGTGTIVNDDSPGKLQFSGPTFNVSEDGGSVLITVTRVDGATNNVTVDYATSNGTATAGSDYTATSGTLTFLQGDTSRTFSVPILSDNVFEVDETFNLTLSNASGGAAFGGPAVVTIKTPPLYLVLEESAPIATQVAALDSLLLLRDPFPLIQPMDLLNPGSDRNTRVLVYVSNLQLAPSDVPSAVRVLLVDSKGQTFDVGAEDVRSVPFGTLMQITFRLPDNLASGFCAIKITSHDQQSNTGTIRTGN